MLAAKFFDDHYYNNSYYARVGGVSASEINALELEFLYCLNFSVAVDSATFSRYYNELRIHLRTLRPTVELPDPAVNPYLTPGMPTLADCGYPDPPAPSLSTVLAQTHPGHTAAALPFAPIEPVHAAGVIPLQIPSSDK